MANRIFSPLIIIGAGLLAISAGVYGLDSLRQSHRGGQIEYVLKHAREVTTDGSTAITDGDLIVAVDVALPEQKIIDPDLGFSVEALRYTRDAEIYQWKETENVSTHTNSDGSRNTNTSYSYSKIWSDRTISSSLFYDNDYRNYGSFPFSDRTYRPENVTFGTFKLDKSFNEFFPAASKLSVTREMFDGMPEEYRRRFAVVNGGLFPDRSPQIGDIRVSFTAVMPTQATVVGAYQNGIIVPAQTTAGEIAMYRVGNMSLEDLAAQEKSDSSRTSTILLIIAGIIAAAGAICLMIGIKDAFSGNPVRSSAY